MQMTTKQPSSQSQPSSIRIKTSKAPWAKKKQIQSNTKKQNDSKQWPDLSTKTKTKSIETSNDNNPPIPTPNITHTNSNGHTNNANNTTTESNQNISNKSELNNNSIPNNTDNISSKKNKRNKRKKKKTKISDIDTNNNDSNTPKPDSNNTISPKSQNNSTHSNNENYTNNYRNNKHRNNRRYNSYRRGGGGGYGHDRGRGRGRGRGGRGRGRGGYNNSYRNNNGHNNYYDDDGYNNYNNYYRNNRRDHKYYHKNNTVTAPRHNRHKNNNNYNYNNNNNNGTISDTTTATTTSSSTTIDTTPTPIINNNINNISNLTWINNPYTNIYATPTMNMNMNIYNGYNIGYINPMGMNYMNIQSIEPSIDSIHLCINELNRIPDWAGEKPLECGPYYILKVSCVAVGYGPDDRSVGHIALIDWNLKTKANIFVKPKQDIISYIEPLTSLNKSILDKYGYDLEDAIKIIKSELPKNAVLIGQNITMDLQWLGLVSGKDFKTFIDLRDIWRTWSEYYKSYTHYSLNHQSKCILNCDISDYKKHKHSASFDGITTMKLFQYYAYCRYFNMSLFNQKIQLLQNTKIQPSFSKIYPVFEGVQMQSKKYKGVPYITNIGKITTTANKNDNDDKNDDKNDNKKIINE